MSTATTRVCRCSQWQHVALASLLLREAAFAGFKCERATSLGMNVDFTLSACDCVGVGGAVVGVGGRWGLVLLLVGAVAGCCVGAGVGVRGVLGWCWRSRFHRDS